MSPLDREPPQLVEERCDECHVPLHDGRELHWSWRRDVDRGTRVLVRVMKSHRCTARAIVPLPIPLVNGRWKMVDE